MERTVPLGGFTQRFGLCGYALELSELYASSKLPVGRFEGRGSMRIKSEFEMGDLFSLDVLLEPVSLHRV